MRVRKMSFFFAVFMLILNITAPARTYQERIEKRDQMADFDTNRWHWQQPSKIMDAIGIRPGMVIADVGAGYGYFALGMAKLVGEEGKVYANEIDEHCLRIIEQECKDERITNVITILGEAEDPKLPKGEMDIVLMTNVLHYFDTEKERVSFLNKIIPSLKSTGKLVIVQWKRDRTAGANSPDVYKKNIEQAGYKITSTETFLPKQVIYICGRGK